VDRPKYSCEEWNLVSALPKHFFEQYASLITKKTLKTKIDVSKIVIDKVEVANTFSEEDLFELFDGALEGLIIAHITKNQHLFVVDTSSDSV